VFGLHEKITKCKNQSLANVAGILQRLARKFDRIRLESSRSGRINGRILAVLARSSWINSRIRPDPVGSQPFWPESNNIPAGIWSAGGRIPATVEFRWPDSGDRMLSDSGADWIPTTDNC
jgi:hypothetical protein